MTNVFSLNGRTRIALTVSKNEIAFGAGWVFLCCRGFFVAAAIAALVLPADWPLEPCLQAWFF
jgi:hypothetical protein